MTTALDSLPGRIAVVPGGAGAIGTAITEALREAGHRTGVLDRDAEIACDLGAETSTRAAAAVVTDAPASRVVNIDEQFDATVDRQALRRRLTPDDTAAAVAYLASDAAAAMTGQVLCADGGPHHEVAGTVPPPLGQGMRVCGAPVARITMIR